MFVQMDALSLRWLQLPIFQCTIVGKIASHALSAFPLESRKYLGLHDWVSV